MPYLRSRHLSSSHWGVHPAAPAGLLLLKHPAAATCGKLYVMSAAAVAAAAAQHLLMHRSDHLASTNLGHLMHATLHVLVEVQGTLLQLVANHQHCKRNNLSNMC
jgi:hypothetical protein